MHLAITNYAIYRQAVILYYSILLKMNNFLRNLTMVYSKKNKLDFRTFSIVRFLGVETRRFGNWIGF
jgi:hypothetical protein